MEHDIDLIRQKVWEADARAVDWRKGWAWQQVSLPAPVKSRRPGYFVAAASVLIAAFLLGYFLQVIQRRNLQARIEALEQAIRNEVTAQQATRLNEFEADCKKGATALRIETKANLSHKSRSVGKVPLKDFAPENQVASPEISLTASVIPEVEPPTPQGVTAEPLPVQAIVGYIPLQKTTSVAMRKAKKSRIHFLKSAETEFSASSDERKWVVARIN